MRASLTREIHRGDPRKPPLPWWEGKKGRGKIRIHPHPHPPPSKGEVNKGTSLRLLFSLSVVFILLDGVSNALPTYDEVRQSYVKSDSLLLDRHGGPLYELRTDKVRRRLDWTSLRNISPVLKVAVIKAEDKRFYEHPGFDYKSVGGAIIQGLTSESLRGASTITMQLASLLDRELQPKKERKSIWQKGRQAL